MTNKTKKVKTAKNNMLPPEKVRVVDVYQDLYFNKEMPVNEAFIDRLAQEMIDFAELETTIRPSQFWISKRLHNQNIYRWKEKWPQLERAYAHLLSQCALRRDIGAVTKKFDGNYVDKTQAMYDPEYKKFLEWKASLADRENTLGNIKVVLDNYERSPMVPDKSSDKEL